jgi:FkbM family methyltransferase
MTTPNVEGRAEATVPGRDPARELDVLLSADPAEAVRRAAEPLRGVGGGARRLVLYGAGALGRAVLARLRRAGVEPSAFADDTPGKQGQAIEGVPVMRPREAAERFGPALVFAVTILNPALRFLDAKERLERATGTPAVSYLHLAWKYPAAFLPLGPFELPGDVRAKAREIREAFAAFADGESRRQFVAHLRFRLRLEHAALPANSRDDYFPEGVLPELPADAVFVDCGAFDGDTLRRFLERQRGRFGAAYAFEPDAENFRRLREYVGGLAPEAAGRIRLFRAGVGERRARLRFNATGDTGAALSEEGGAEVEVLPLGEVVEAAGRAVYVKFDVEGAEWEALRGAEALIRDARPLLAVSVYHRPDDLWQLPLRLRALDPASRLYLRTQGEDGMDVICYAVPADKSRES